MSPPPDPVAPAPARVDITPEVVDRAAANFATGQRDLISAYTALSRELAAHSAGMAGFDKAAHQFAALYDPAAKAAYAAFHKAIEALGGTSLGLTQTINNHLAADHHSRADRPGGVPPRYPPHPVSQHFAVGAAPPSVIGAMSWAPNTTVPLIRNAVPNLPGWVDDLLGTSDDWPQANPQMFDQTGAAWAAAAREIEQVASWLNWTITTILDPADNAEHTAVATYWATLYRPGDPATVIAGLHTMCTALAGACHDYAQATRDATRIVTGEHIIEIILTLGAGAVAGLLRKLLGRILSRVGAYMLSRVAAIGERLALREILANLLKATADTKVIKAVQATFDRTVTKALDRAMGRLARDGPGVWRTANEHMSARAAAYQEQITGQPAGTVYDVGGVRFDGFQNGSLVDAKGPGYANFVKNGEFQPFFDGRWDLLDQAERQAAVAGRTPITWYVAEPEAANAMRRFFAEQGFAGRIKFVTVPAR